MKYLITLLMLLTSGWVGAEAPYPNRPVKIIVGFAAGTSPDIVMRVIEPHLSKLWGQPLVIENRAGAAGNIASQMVVSAPADGYTLLNAINSMICSNPHMLRMQFDPTKALVPVTQLVNIGYVLLARSGLPVSDLNQLLKMAKAEPGKLTYSSSGPGSGNHIAMELFQRMSGIKLLHVPMRSNTTMSVYSSETDLTFSPYTTGVPAASSGKAKPLGVSLPQRLDAIPNVPAISEVVPNFQADAWHGVFAPAGTPKPVVDKVAADIARVLAEPAVKKRLHELGLETVGSNPADFASVVKRDYDKWGRVIREADIKLD